MFKHDAQLQVLFAALLLVLYIFNVQQMMVNSRLGSVYNSMIATLRPAGVWVVELSLYSATKHAVGDPWTNPWSWIQLVGL